jgi:tetratricopeptide (TPR) repeat protein
MHNYREEAEALVVAATAEPVVALQRITALLDESNEDLLTTVLLIQAKGLALRSLFRIDEAIAAFDHAIELADRFRLQAQRSLVRISRSGALIYAGDTVGALADLDDAEILAGGKGRAAVRHQRGAVLTMLGRYEEGVADTTAALRAFRGRNDRLWEARALLNRSHMHLLAGRPDRGIRDARQAQRVFLAIDHQSGQTKSLDNLGCLLALSGRVPEALSVFRDVDARLHVLGVPLILSAEGRVIALLHAGLGDDALDVATRARAEFDQHSSVGSAADIDLSIARAAAQIGDTRSARVAAQRASDEFVHHGRTTSAAMADLLLASLARELDPNVALQMGALFNERGWRSRAQEAWLLGGDTARRAGNLRDAERCLLLAARRSPMSTITARIGALRAGALLELVNGRIPSALDLVAQALRLAQANQRALFATELRSAAGGVTQEVAQLGIEIASTLNDSTVLWRWVEQPRFIANMRAQSNSSPVPNDDIVTRLRATSAQIDDATFSGRTPPVNLTALQSTLEHELRAHDREANTRGKRTRPAVRQDRLSRALGHRVFVHYFEVDGRVRALRTDSNRSSVYDLCSVPEMCRSVNDLRSSMLRAITSNAPGSKQWDTVEVRANRVEDLILSTLSVGSDVVISPFGRLFALPWSALPSLQQASVSLVASATSWSIAARDKRPPDDPSGQRVLTVAGPDLPFADEEQQRIGGVWSNATALRGADANPFNVTRRLSQCDIAHISCHATLRVDSPSFSSLHLAGGPLMLRDLEALSTVPSLVVLSACGAGQGVETASGQLLGLGSVLLGSGVRTVVAAVLPVVDVSLPGPMEILHTRLALGDSPGHALTRARQSTTTGSASTRASLCSFVTLGLAS